MAISPSNRRPRGSSAITAAGSLVFFFAVPARAQDSAEDRIKKLESEFINYKKQSEQERDDLRRELSDLKKQITSTPPAGNQQTVDDAIAELQARVESIRAKQDLTNSAQGKRVSYIDVSFDILTNVGASQATDGELDIVQPGGHDPKQRGFTLSQGELSLQGAVDPNFRGDAHVVLGIDRAGETFIELEEAYLTTTSLPWNLQIKGGQYFTEFGRLNRQHPHEWDFVDQPLVNNRMFGGDGLRAPGVRAAWLAPTSFFLELQSGIQNARGETVTSFLGNDAVFTPVTGSSGAEIPGSFGGHPFTKTDVNSFGDMLFTERISASIDLTETQTFLAGASALFGPNSTGDGGRTEIYGFDFIYKWKPQNSDQGWPFVKIQNEWMWRRAHAASVNFDLDGDSIPEVFNGETFHDWGAYAQLLVGFARPWVAGARFDYTDGDGASTGGFGALDRRYRVSPNITYYPSEFSKIRLQANFDRVQELNDHMFMSIWLQVEILFGAHGAHKF